MGAKHRSQICKMGSSKTIIDLFQPAAKRFKVSASDNTPNSKPLLQVVSQKLPLSSKSSNTSSLTTEQQSRIEFNRCLAKSKRNLKACSQKVSKSKGWFCFFFFSFFFFCLIWILFEVLQSRICYIAI